MDGLKYHELTRKDMEKRNKKRETREVNQNVKISEASRKFQVYDLTSFKKKLMPEKFIPYAQLLADNGYMTKGMDGKLQSRYGQLKEELRLLEKVGKKFNLNFR